MANPNTPWALPLFPSATTVTFIRGSFPAPAKGLTGVWPFLASEWTSRSLGEGCVSGLEMPPSSPAPLTHTHLVQRGHLQVLEAGVGLVLGIPSLARRCPQPAAAA